MTDPLRISFDVACPAEHAFRTWTARLGTWWPPDHTVSGQPARVVLQSGVGGRIYEQAPDGTEHEWGQVTVWQPPTRLAYTWYLGRDQADATEVEITFHQSSTEQTRVDIEHRGWQRINEEWRARTYTNWQSLLPHYQKEIARGRWHQG